MKSGRPTSNIREIRLYRPGDETGIARLFKEVFGRDMSLEEWRWKYIESNPGKVYSSVAINEELAIVGHYGAVRVPLIYKGKPAGGLAICDVMVLPPFRGIKTLKKISSLTPCEAVRDGIIVGYGFPERNALLKPALRLGIYELVEDVMECAKEVAFHDNVNRYRFKLFPLDYSDPRIDRLWDRCKKELTLAVVRDRRYLTWRYKNHPLFRYELFGLRGRIGRSLVGLAVLKRQEDRVLLVDFVSPKEHLPVLLEKIENLLHSGGAEALTLWIPPFMAEAFTSLGFLVKNGVTAIPRTTQEPTLAKKDIAGNFFYTMGDTDFL
jgi:hypothetical protein